MAWTVKGIQTGQLLWGLASLLLHRSSLAYNILSDNLQSIFCWKQSKKKKITKRKKYKRIEKKILSKKLHLCYTEPVLNYGNFKVVTSKHDLSYWSEN